LQLLVLYSVLVGWGRFAAAAEDPVPSLTGQAERQQESVWPDYFQSQRQERLVEEARRALVDFRFREAEDLLDQALQVNRASAGLYNASQLNVLDEMLEALLRQQKWREFDQRLDYMSWLIKRLYAEDPERLAEGLQRQSRWYRAAAAADSGTSSAWYLIQGKYLDWQAVSVLENHFGQSDPRLAPILYQIVLSHFYQTVSIERRGMTSFEFKTEQKVIANGWMSSRSETVRRSYRIGRELLQRISSIYALHPDASDVTDALLRIQLGDWEYLHGATEEALTLYRQAYRQLVRSGIPEAEVDAFFGRPQVLPVEQLQLRWEQVRAGAESGESALEFNAWSTVYPGAHSPIEFLQPPFNLPRRDNSRVRVLLRLNSGQELNQGSGGSDEKPEITVLEAEPDEENLRSRAVAEIPLLVFRPRLQSGELVDHEPILLDYRFAPE